MALEKTLAVDKIEVLDNSVVQVRNAIRILENGSVISSSFERVVIAPGDDYSTQPGRVKAICQVVHTPDAVAAYKAAQPQVE